MLIQSLGLTGLLFIASTIANAVPPVGLKPRYHLATGTAISLSTTPSATTSSADGIATSTTTPTDPLPSTSTSAATAPSSSPSKFHLVASGTGTYFDGYYLTLGRANRGIGHGDLDVMSFVRELPPYSSEEATFYLADNNNTLRNSAFGGDMKSFNLGPYYYWFVNSRYLEPWESYESVCEIVGGGGGGGSGGGGELRCVTGQYTLFFICIYVFPDGPWQGQAVNDEDLMPLVGSALKQDYCNPVPLTLLVEPVEDTTGEEEEEEEEA